MANVPVKTQEQRAEEKRVQRKEKIIRILQEINDKKIVLAQLEKQLAQELAEV